MTDYIVRRIIGMKKEYETPEANIIMFETEDIVRTSGFSATGDMNEINFNELLGINTSGLKDNSDVN